MELASWNARTMVAVQSCGIDSNKIVFNNTDPSKYFSARFENTDYKFYNSAICILGTGIDFFIICEEQTTQTFYHNGTPSGTKEMNVENNNLWSNPMCSSSPMHIYCVTWNNYGSLISSSIPVFYNYEEYLDYITNVAVPEISTTMASGGAGLYGGKKGNNTEAGGAGSGYIANSEIQNKHMHGYNVPTSDTVSTKTTTSDDVSSIHLVDNAQAGNGFARVRRLASGITLFKDITKAKNLDNVIYNNIGNADITDAAVLAMSDNFLNDRILCVRRYNGNNLIYFDGNEGYATSGKTAVTNCRTMFPIPRINVKAIRLEYIFDDGGGADIHNSYIYYYVTKINDATSITNSTGLWCDRTSTWTQMTLILPEAFDADYLTMDTCSCGWHFKNVEFI